MKLQMNERGSWRDLAVFPDMPLERAQREVISYTRAFGSGSRAGRHASYRITRDGRTALAYLEAPYKAWRKA